MRKRSHGIKFTDADWQTLQRLAIKLGFRTAGQLVSELCRRCAEENDEQWEGGATWGGNRKGK